MRMKSRGVLFATISAIIFGTSPIFVKFISAGGINAMTQLLFRATFTMIFAVILTKAKKQSLQLEKGLFRDAFFAFFVGQGVTGILLNSSYYYLSAGMATSLHFVYPSVVMIVCMLFFREKVNVLKLLAMLLSVAAVILVADFQSKSQTFGFVLAIGSGCTYAFYIVLFEHSKLREYPMSSLLFWMSLGSLSSAAALGALTGTLDVSGTTIKGILLLAVMALIQSVIAVRLFQLGVRYAGAVSTSLLSTMEPVTSIALGTIIFGEYMSAVKTVGCGFILLSVLLTILGTKYAGNTEFKTASSKMEMQKND